MVGFDIPIEPPIKWAFWQPQVKLVAEKVNASRIENRGVRAMVRLKLLNTGTSNAIDPKLRIDLPHWNFGRRQSGFKIRWKSMSEDPESDSDGDAADAGHKERSRDSGLNFGDCQLDVTHNRTGRLGGGEIYNVSISGVLPKNDEPEDLCFGHVVLDEDQSNTLDYTISTQTQGSQRGQITFHGHYNDISIESSAPSMWYERYDAGRKRTKKIAGGLSRRVFSEKEVGNVEKIEDRNILFVDPDTDEQWYLPSILVRLSSNVETRRDLTATAKISLDREGTHNTIGSVSLQALSIEPGEYWETTVSGIAWKEMTIEWETDYGGPLDRPFPIPVSELGEDTDVSDLQIEWELSEEELPSRDNRQLEFYDYELTERGSPVFEGKIRNANRTSRTPFIGAKFYAESNEVLYTPTEMVELDGSESRPFSFWFSPFNKEDKDRVARCEPFFH